MKEEDKKDILLQIVQEKKDAEIKTKKKIKKLKKPKGI